MFSRKTSTPALNNKVFMNFDAASTGEVMTLQGTINKTLLSFLLLLMGAIYTWSKFSQAGEMASLIPYMAGGGIGGFILALITIFKKEWSPFTVPLYSVLEGIFIGGLSLVIDLQFQGQGLVMRAVALTFGTFFAMLFLYRSGIIKVNRKFVMGVVAATGGIFIIYLLSWIMGMFGINTGILYGNSIASIGFSLVVVAIAALNLVLDFDFIDKGSRAGVPKFMEWYAAFGLMVTLIWLYIEILRLLTKLSSRN